MSLDSKHNEMDDFMTLPDKLKELKTKKKKRDTEIKRLWQ